jgi:hypothetical protein
VAPVQSATRAAALTAAFGVADSISRVEALTALAPQLPELSDPRYSPTPLTGPS